jgi:hypothetical protein
MSTQLKPRKLFMISWLVGTVVATTGWIYFLIDMTWSLVDVLFE